MGLSAWVQKEGLGAVDLLRFAGDRARGDRWGVSGGGVTSEPPCDGGPVCKWILIRVFYAPVIDRFAGTFLFPVHSFVSFFRENFSSVFLVFAFWQFDRQIEPLFGPDRIETASLSMPKLTPQPYRLCPTFQAIY